MLLTAATPASWPTHQLVQGLAAVIDRAALPAPGAAACAALEPPWRQGEAPA